MISSALMEHGQGPKKSTAFPISYGFPLVPYRVFPAFWESVDDRRSEWCENLPYRTLCEAVEPIRDFSAFQRFPDLDHIRRVLLH